MLTTTLPLRALRTNSHMQPKQQISPMISQTRRYSPALPAQYSRHSKPQKPNEPGELPSFNFKDLGATRTVKIVVIAGLTVIGTMETIFYAKILMRKMGWDGEGEGEGEGEKE